MTVHRWVARYRESGLAGLADRSHAPKVRIALFRGSQPAVPGAPFLLHVASGDLPAEVKTETTPGDPWARLGL